VRLKSVCCARFESVPPHLEAVGGVVLQRLEHHRLHARQRRLVALRHALEPDRKRRLFAGRRRPVSRSPRMHRPGPGRPIHHHTAMMMVMVMVRMMMMIMMVMMMTHHHGHDDDAYR
jgi:hypothetical protein